MADELGSPDEALAHTSPEDAIVRHSQSDRAEDELGAAEDAVPAAVLPSMPPLAVSLAVSPPPIQVLMPTPERVGVAVVASPQVQPTVVALTEQKRRKRRLYWILAAAGAAAIAVGAIAWILWRHHHRHENDDAEAEATPEAEDEPEISAAPLRAASVVAETPGKVPEAATGEAPEAAPGEAPEAASVERPLSSSASTRAVVFWKATAASVSETPVAHRLTQAYGDSVVGLHVNSGATTRGLSVTATDAALLDLQAHPDVELIVHDFFVRSCEHRVEQALTGKDLGVGVTKASIAKPTWNIGRVGAGRLTATGKGPTVDWSQLTTPLYVLDTAIPPHPAVNTVRSRNFVPTGTASAWRACSPVATGVASALACCVARPSSHSPCSTATATAVSSTSSPPFRRSRPSRTRDPSTRRPHSSAAASSPTSARRNRTRWISPSKT